MYEVHARQRRMPALLQAHGSWRSPTLQRHMLAPSHSHTHLETFETVQPVDVIFRQTPAFASEQRMNSQIAEPWSRRCDLADPHPQR